MDHEGFKVQAVVYCDGCGMPEDECCGVLALADVCTLDDWCQANPERCVELYSHDDRQTTLLLRDEEEDRFDFYGPAPYEARAKAAAWVREQAKAPTCDHCGEPGQLDEDGRCERCAGRYAERCQEAADEAYYGGDSPGFYGPDDPGPGGR